MEETYIGVVETKSGKVKGQELNGGYEGITLFKGIPYALPPTGELRWRPPQDVKPWEGIRICTDYGPICPQPSNGDLGQEPWGSDFYWMGGPHQSEDCLYLNIATGAVKRDEKRPVYVWFHGGGTDHGYAHEVEFDPREMAKKGVVVVSVNHRLGPFGYMALPQLTAEQGHSGNYILMDHVKAMEWIIENIAQFGGDPDCITVGGQSAGCQKSASVAYTPQARGHVKRVINESWLNWFVRYHTQDEEEKDWIDYLEHLGIDPDATPGQLRQIDAARFIPTDGFRIPGHLVYDGNLIPHQNLADSIAEFGMELDYLSGSNLGETHMKPDTWWGEYGFQTPQEFYDYCHKAFPDLCEQYSIEKLVPVNEKNTDMVSRKLASLGLGIWRWPGGLMLNRYFGAYRKKHAPERKSFSYLFTRIPPVREADKGTGRDADLLMAWHSSELWYTFHSLREGVPPCRPWEEIDYKLAETMNNYWVNFIKNGDPNGEGLPLWPESDNDFGYVELGETIIGHRGIEGELDQMIYQYVTTQLELPEL